MRWLAGALLLAAAACTSSPPAPPVTPEVAACNNSVYQDPAVKTLIEKGAGSPTFMREHDDDLKVAKSQAALRCLQARGLARPGGGVERPRVRS